MSTSQSKENELILTILYLPHSHFYVAFTDVDHSVTPLDEHGPDVRAGWFDSPIFTQAVLVVFAMIQSNKSFILH